MFKRLTLALCLALPVTSFAGVDGVWQCNVKVKTTAKANGRATTGIDYSSGTQTLLPDSTYTSTTPVSPIVAHGTYTIRKRTIKFLPNYDDLIAVAEQACTQAGSSCMVSAVTGKSTATLNKANTSMKGNGSLKMSMLVNGSVLIRSVAVSAFTCTRR